MKKITSCKKFGLIIALLMVVSCASETLKLETHNLSPLVEYSRVTAVRSNGQSIKMGKFKDSRKNKRAVGEASTGIFNTPTPVVLDVSLDKYVSSRISSGLTDRGMIVSDDAPYIIKGRIEKFWVTETTNSWTAGESICFVQLYLGVFPRDSKKPRWHGQIRGRAISGVKGLDTTAYNGDTLESCMNKVVENLIRDKEFQQATEIRL